MSMVKLDDEAYTALIAEQLRRISATGNAKISKKDVASDLIRKGLGKMKVADFEEVQDA